VLEPEIVVEPARRVLLHDEEPGGLGPSTGAAVG